MKLPIACRRERFFSMRPLGSSRVAAILVLAFALTPTGPVAAEGSADEAKGLIAEYCADCHVIPGYEKEISPAIEAPPLGEIAADQATYTEDRLRKSLRQPHWPMGQFRLSGKDIDNIMAFIAELRNGTP